MKNYNFLTSPIGRTLFFKSLPVILGIFANIAYNLVDTYFVAKLGTSQLAAMSFSFPVVMIMINVTMGISIGITSVVSRAIGAKQIDYSKKLITKGVELTIFVSLILTFLGLITIEPLFSLLGVDAELMVYTKDYMKIWYLGMVFMNLSAVGAAIFRAKGNVLFPSVMLILGAILNGVLDPLLIFGYGIIPKMGLKGAAITTVFGNFLSAFFIFYKLRKDEKIKIPTIPRSFDLSLIKKILFIAVPAALANSLTPISTALTNKMLVAFGNTAVAANSIATRIETVPFIAIFGLGFVLSPFIAQNWGAGNFSRIKLAIAKSFIFSYLLGLVTAAILMVYKNNIILIFDSNPKVIAITSTYFGIIPLTYGVLGTVFLTTQAMNAIGKPFLGNFLSCLRLIIIYLPLACVLNMHYDITGIFISRFIANTFVGIMASFFIYKIFYRATTSKLKIIEGN